jgi:UDP-N-acetylenolpyruvoylglucosamine reductase
MTEFKGDKRSKEYKEWKKKYDKKSKGLGDTVEKITTATGIKKAVKWLAGEDCGCDERKEKLNKLFDYQKPDCLTESEYVKLSDIFAKHTNTITPDIQVEILTIYNRVFKENASTTSCGSCFANNVYNKLKKLYAEYK